MAVTTLAVAAISGLHSVGAEQQGRTTRAGTPPTITAESRQTNWASHNLDLRNQRYAELDRINTATVGQLQRRWSFDVPAGLNVSQVTPLVVDGLMYFHSGATVLAINAVTGDEVWTLEVDGVSGGVVRGPLLRQQHDLLPTTATSSWRPMQRPGRSSRPSATAASCRFSDGRYKRNTRTSIRQASMPPRSTTGSIARPPITTTRCMSPPRSPKGISPAGLVVVADATTGEIKWVFNTIPQRPQDEGWELADPTWGDGKRVGAGIWTQPAIDVELGLLYFNTANPNPPYDGSARPGANLFTNSTIALDLETGALRWYYQTIHHDLWDWDNVTGPVLFDVTRNGETIKGVGAAGKNCLLYLWHRETGEPINPMVETLVPTETNVPGEVVYPTQPIPHNARGVPLTPFCATYLDLDDPELQAQARQMYTPYSTDEHYIVAHGGSSFGSPSFSPRTGLLYVTGKNAGVSLLVKPLGDSLKLGEGGGHAKNFTEIDPDPGLPAHDHADSLRAGQR